MNISTEQLASALVLLTQRGEIRWKAEAYETVVILNDGGRVDGYVYETILNEKKVSLFRYTYDFHDENENLRRDYSFRLVVSGLDDHSESEFDGKYSLSTLFDIVRETCHDVSEWAQAVVESVKLKKAGTAVRSQ